MDSQKIKRIVILLLKLVAIEETLTFIFVHYFFEITPTAVSVSFIVSFAALVALNWYTKNFQRKGYFKPAHILLIIVPLFLAVHFRAGIFWALNTFPLRDANMVMLTLQEPFDDFAYSMIWQYLNTTIPQALVITAILTFFLYNLWGTTKRRVLSIGVYFIATIVLFIYEIPVSDYIHILNNEPEKNASYSEFFVKNYVNPDSVKITAPEQKRNLILIYLESLETTFADKEHGGNQDTNLIPEITELSLQNLSFGKNNQLIGGGYDASGSNSTFCAMHARSLGIPSVTKYKTSPISQHYTSLYKILNKNNYNQVFFQANSGLYNEFQYFMVNQNVDEVYGPEELVKRLNPSLVKQIKREHFMAGHDKDAFTIAKQFLDTLSEPFALTFFTIDTHAPSGLYDPECIKASDENNEDERLKAAERCVSRELDKFLTTLKSKPFYNNTTIIIFGDHQFMGTRLVKDATNRRWVNIFINTPKTPVASEKRFFTDIDMFPTILSSINFDIEGDKLGFGTDLFSDKKTLLESIGLDSLNKEIAKFPSHLTYESYLLKKNSK